MKPKLERNETTLVLRIPGDLTSTTVNAAREAIGTTLDSPDSGDWQLFTLDLSAAQMVDSVGLNLIVAMYRSVQKLGRRMQVSYRNPNVHRTFVFTRLSKYIALAGS